MLRLSACCGLCVLMAVVGGCGSGPERAPSPAAIEDREAHTATRERAMERVWEAVEAGEITHAAARETLKRVIWRRSEFHETRLAALEALLEDAEHLEDTRNMLRLLLPTETQWEMIERIAELSADGGWRGLTVAFVRSWSREVVEPADEDRPERAALEALYPEREPVDVVFGVFTGEIGGELRERDRLEAWGLLRRIDPDGDRVRELLAGLEGSVDDPVLAALRAGARDFGVVPATGPELERLVAMREEENRRWWADAAEAAGYYERLHGGTLELRHVPVIMWAVRHEPDWVAMERGELLALLERELDGRERSARTTGVGAHRALPQRVEAFAGRMTWGDALSALAAARVVADASIAGPLFELAARDLADTSTEHGGLLVHEDGAIRVLHFPPRPAQRLHDRAFVASADMLARSTDALFHFHMQTQRWDNSRYAGPSQGDVRYARLHGVSCVVFTSTDRDTLNADYYQPDGVVIDLGSVSRPGS